MTDWNNFNEPKKPLTRAQLIEQLTVLEENKRRYDEMRALYYKVCGPKHKAFHESRKAIRIFFGGNRSGKTTAGLLELVYRACFKAHPFTKEVNKRSGRYRIFTEKYQLVETFVIPLLQTWIPRKWLRGGKWDTAYDSRNHLLHGADGTLIDIMTYDQDVAGAASVELDGVWADEEMPERLFAETITRLISRKGKLWLTVTPMYSLTWAMKYWDKVDDANVEVFKVSIHDNPNLPEAEKLAIIANWPEHERKSRESGLFMEFEGLVYKELDNHVHYLRESKQPEPSYPVVMAMDPHQRKGTVITWSYVDEHEDVIFFDELEIKGTASQVVEAIKGKEALHHAPTLLRLIDPAANKQISGFGSEVTTLREFQDAGMGFSMADNNQAGYNVVHEYLTFDKTQPLSSSNRPHCYFTQDVQKTWHGMAHLLWDEYKFGRENRDPKEHVKDREKDFPDCVRYTLAIRPRFKYQNQPVSLNLQSLHYGPKAKPRISYGPNGEILLSKRA